MPPLARSAQPRGPPGQAEAEHHKQQSPMHDTPASFLPRPLAWEPLIPWAWLRVRYGLLAEGRVPYPTIARVERDDRAAPKAREGGGGSYWSHGYLLQLPLLSRPTVGTHAPSGGYVREEAVAWPWRHPYLLVPELTVQ